MRWSRDVQGCGACPLVGWRVGPGGAGYVDLAVGDGDGPVACVEVDVVTAAEQDEVGDLGFAAVDPRDEVVGVALDRWGAAHYAAAVAGVEGAAHGAGH